MTIAFEVGVSNLFPELFADAFVFFGSLQAAGTVSAGAFQALPNGFDGFLILVESYCHKITSFFFYYTTSVKG